MKSLISQLTGMPERRVKSDLAQICPKEVPGVGKDASVDEKYNVYMSREAKGGRTNKGRQNTRIAKGRATYPKYGLECHSWGNDIIKSQNHCSMMRSKELVDDEEFLCHAARITPNPRECSNFFYEYVNEYLKKNKKFRVNFLKGLFLNEHILTRRDIKVFVDAYEFGDEYETITKDVEFKKEVKQVLQALIDAKEVSEYRNYDGISWASSINKYPNPELAKDAKLRLKDLLSSFEEIKKIKISEDEISVD